MQAGRFQKETAIQAHDVRASNATPGETVKLLGPAVLDTSVNKNKFKSSFGEPPVVEKKQNFGASTMRKRKPVSFYDSKRIEN